MEKPLPVPPTETEKDQSSKDQEGIVTFRETGMTSKSKHITTRDLIYIAIFGVIGGIISSTVPFSMLIKFWYPLTGGTQLVSGHHVIWFTMVYGLTKKFGSATTCSLIKGFFEFLLGDSYGAVIIGIDILQGFIVDLLFFLASKKGEDESKLGWALAGGFATFSQAPIFWLISGNIFILPWMIALTAFLFAFISGVLLAGLLGKVIRDGLIRAGVPVPFSIPKRISPEIQS